MSNAGYFGKSEIQISGEEYQLCRPTLFLTGLLLYVNKDPHPQEHPKAPHYRPQSTSTENPNPKNPIEDPDPKTQPP